MTTDPVLETIYDELAAAGVVLAVVRWQGSGDEGWVGDGGIELYGADNVMLAVDLPEGLTDRLVDAVGTAVDDNFAGWEINEGGMGYADVKVAERKTTLNHSWIVESTEDAPQVVL